MTTGNHHGELNASYSEEANVVWRGLNTAEQILSIFEIASKSDMKSAEVQDNRTYSVLPGIVC